MFFLGPKAKRITSTKQTRRNKVLLVLSQPTTGQVDQYNREINAHKILSSPTLLNLGKRRSKTKQALKSNASGEIVATGWVFISLRFGVQNEIIKAYGCDVCFNVTCPYVLTVLGSGLLVDRTSQFQLFKGQRGGIPEE
ncbi:MAG: hypothetical protein AAGK33_05250 [Pseudomonadota bacterium]